jgi:Protein of unknown function (DUF3306)
VSERENFIARWSRRKRRASENPELVANTRNTSPWKGEVGDPGLEPGEPGGGQARPSHAVADPHPTTLPSLREAKPVDLPLAGGGITEPGARAAAVDLANLPPIESITAESDIRAFLAPGIPPELTRAALRRAWAADPRIRDFVGLSENSWDFNSPDAIGGFGPLEMTHELRQQIAQFVGRNIAATSDAAASSAKAVNDERPAVEVAAASDAAGGDAPALENSAAPAEPGHAELSDSACIATQGEHPPDRPPAPAKRPHGGALPK